MLRLPLSLLLVSLVLAIDHSTDGRFNRRKILKLDSTLTDNFPQRRQQQPHVQIREENAGRYFRRRPQTTTVSSIFSMKVENESQHVYPNMAPLKNLHIQPKQDKINMTDISITTHQQNFPPTRNWNNPRPNNVQRRIPFTRRRRPSYAQTAAPIIQQAEEITEQVVTSTTTAPIAVDDTVKEQGKVVLVTSDSNVSNEVPSLEKRQPTISEIPEAFIQGMEETPEHVVILTSNAPVIISTTEKVPEKRDFTPSTIYLSNPKFYVRRRRPNYARTSAPIVQQEEEIIEEVVTSKTTQPIVIDATGKEQEKVVLVKSDSNVANNVSSLENRHQTVSQILEAFIKKIEDAPEQIVVSTTNAPVVVSSTEKVPEKFELTQSAAYVSNPKFYVKRRRPSDTRTSTQIIQQAEGITEQVFTSTTAASIVVDATENEQEKMLLATSDSSASNEDPSLEKHHLTITETPEAFIQKIEVTPDQVVISTSNAPVIVSSTEKVRAKSEFTPSATYVSNRKVFVKRRRPSYTRTSTPIIQQAEEITELNSSVNLSNPKFLVRRRRPTYARTSAPIIQQEEEIIPEVVTSTTTSSIVVDATGKEKEEVVLTTSDSNISNEVPSSEIYHPTISKIPEALFQRKEETNERVVISTSKAPVVISTTEKLPEKLEFTPSAAYISNVMSFVKRRRPIFAQKTASPVIQEKETGKQEQTINSPKTAPNAVSIATKGQDKIVLSPPASYVSDLVSIVRPKNRRPLNRGPHKFNWNDINKNQSNVQAGDLDSNSSQLTSTTPNTPPPMPTLSPWYDGFGK